MPTWLIKLFQSVGRKQAAKRTGIAQIPTRISAEAKGAEYFNILVDAGLKPKDMSKYIKSEKDIIRLVNRAENFKKQQLKATKKYNADVDKAAEDALEQVSKDPFKGFKPRIQQDVDSIVKNLKSMEPVTAMKEANLIIGRKGNYKHLSNDEAQRILKETDDHIFQRDIKYDEFGDPIKSDPEDLASGGIARVGMAGGLLVKGANWFIKNFKSLIDEAANPGPWSRFSKMGTKDKQAAIADAKEMIKRLEAGDPVPEYLLEDIVANPKFKLKRSKATDPDLAEVENLAEGYSKLKNAREKKFRGEIKLSPNDPSGAYSRNASSALDDYELFTPVTKDMYGKTWKGKKNWIKEERAKALKTQETIGPAPSSRHPEYRSMVQIRKGLEDRLTALDITEELGGNIKMFDKLRMHNYPTYKNTLDKRDWLMPPGGLKRREAFVIDMGHDTLPSKKIEKQILDKKITTALGTGEDLSSVSPAYGKKYVDQLLRDWKPGKGRKPQAAGGIAGQLHMNDGGRVSFTKGGKVSSGLAKILGV